MATMEEEVDVVVEVEVEVEGEIILFKIFEKLSLDCFVECGMPFSQSLQGLWQLRLWRRWMWILWKKKKEGSLGEVD